MQFKLLIFATLFVFFISCSKEEAVYQSKPKENPYFVYNEAYEALKKGDYFYAQKKFLEVEVSSEKIELASKASLMASFSLYSINFYDEALENLDKFLKKYPANKDAVYAEYLIAIIYYEQIKDETKDIKPAILAKEKVEFHKIELNRIKNLVEKGVGLKSKLDEATYLFNAAVNNLKYVDLNNDLEKIKYSYFENHFFIFFDELIDNTTNKIKSL